MRVLQLPQAAHGECCTCALVRMDDNYCDSTETCFAASHCPPPPLMHVMLNRCPQGGGGGRGRWAADGNRQHGFAANATRCKRVPPLQAPQGPMYSRQGGVRAAIVLSAAASRPLSRAYRVVRRTA
jgi:hypothetical protein